VTLDRVGRARALGTLGLIALAALGWFLVVSPRTGAVAEAQQQAVEVRDRNNSLRRQIEALRAQGSAVQGIREAAAALAARFPPTADQPALFQQVTRAAAQAGIPAAKVTSITPTAPVVGVPGESARAPGAVPAVAGVATQTVTLSVTGTYAQLQRLQANLERMPRAYLVTSLSLTHDGESGGYTANIAGHMFVMPPAPEPRPAPAG
jgi:Tfp pilus assembly protein PilO